MTRGPSSLTWLRRLGGRRRPAPAAPGPFPVTGEAPVGTDLDTGSRAVTGPMADSTEALQPRAWVTVTGEVEATVLRPRSSTQAYVVDLRTSRELVRLVFLGRRSVPGVSAGVRMRVTGRVALHKGTKIMFNPAYDILAGGRHA